MPGFRPALSALRRRPILTGAVLVVLIVLTALLGARVWINSDGGRAYVLSQIDGRKAGSLGTIEAEGLTGDPLTRMHLAHLTLSDETGVWLEAQDISLTWSPRALLSRTVDLNFVSAGEIAISRRPETAQGSSSGESRWSIQLDDLSVGKLSLAEGVAGPAAAFGIQGVFTSDHDGALQARLDITPLEGLGDRLNIAATRDAAGQFKLEADGMAPAGGTFATLLHLRDGQSAELTATAGGTTTEGDGYVELKVSGEDAASVTAKLVAGRLTANAEVDALALPLPETLQGLLGSDARLVLSADIKKHLAGFDATARMASGTLSLTGEADIDAKTLNGPAALQLAFSGLPDLAGIKADLTLDGQLTFDKGIPEYAGNARLVARDGANLPFRALAGPVEVSLEDSRVPFKADLVGEGVLAGNQSLSRIAGAKPHLITSGVYARDTRLLTLAPSVAELAEGRVAASGTISLAERTLDIRGTLDQALGTLPGDFRGAAAGPFRAHGPFGAPLVEANLTARNFAGLPGSLQPLIGGSPSAKVSLEFKGKTISVQSARIAGQGLKLEGRGTYRPQGDSALRFTFDQTAPLAMGDNRFDLRTGSLLLSGPSDARRIELVSQEGEFLVASRTLKDVAAKATLISGKGRISGPVSLTANLSGETLGILSQFLHVDRETRLDDLTGHYGPLLLSGHALIGNDGDYTAQLNLAGDGLKTDNISVAQVRLSAGMSKTGDEAMAFVAHAEGKDAKLSSGLHVDTFLADIENNAEGYDFTANLRSDDPMRPFDFAVSGQADLTGEAPSGTFRLAGSALGEPLTTLEPATWQLGKAPDLDAKLAVLGGRVMADLSGTGEAAVLAVDVENVDFGSLFTLVGLTDVDASLNGRGEFRPVGPAPSGAFAFTATSPIPDLETSLALDLTGRLDARALTVNARANFGQGLVLVADAALPVKTAPDALVQIDREKPVIGRATLNGDIGALHAAALAYGHDVGGTIDASAALSGSLAKPEYKAGAEVKNGLYEFGTSGLRLTDIGLVAAYADHALAVSGSGKSQGGGTVKFKGRLDPDGGQVDADLSKLLVYDREGDSARLSGQATLTQTDKGRIISGKLFVDEARFSLDNLPSAGPKAIDVRWKDGAEAGQGQSRLRQSLGLDLDIDASRRVFVTGRGLDSEWALDLKATGTVSSVRLTGEADLVRGTLDLAGRPFVFDNGKVTFDGPLDTARIAVDAERTVNGFSARVVVSGKPTRPVFELSSTPDLPQDEILSRLLFGRSSMDLSPIEAAQLATSIARLSGRSGGFDPTAGLQAALGLDRLSIGTDEAGNAEVGVGHYIAEDVYLQLNTAGASGSSVEVEWEPVPQVSVTSETTSTGENRVSLRWKKDY